MQHAAQGAAGSRLAQHGHHVGLGVAAMDDDRPIALLRQPQMAVEVIPLQLDWGVVPVAIQPGLAQGDHAGMIQQAFDRPPVAGGRFRTGIRVNADRRKEAWVRFRQADVASA